MSEPGAAAGGPADGAPGAPSRTQFATRHGLAQSGARPGLFAYAGQLWGRRHFIVEYARARNEAQYTATALGQVWQVLTPLLNAAVYFLIFGVLLNTQAHVHNFIAYLVTGVFIFTYTQRAVLSGAKSIAGNLGLIRALHFPRATLTLASTVMELQQLLAAVIVLGGIVLATGERLTLRWLLVVPALALQTLFNSGLALVFARITAQMRDVEQLLPFLLRTWQYASGVFYSISIVTSKVPTVAKFLLEANPAAVYIDIVRAALIDSYQIKPYIWPLAMAWGVGMFLVGLAYFWQAEERYGRG
jgi:teichoic acid transport system permease protein